MPFSLNWLMSRLKKPDLFLFQNHKITTKGFENLRSPRLPRYRSFWATMSAGEQAGGVCTYSRKAFPVALDASLTQSKAHYACSHRYTPVVPLPGHGLFQEPGRVVVSDHGAFVLLNVFLPPPPPRHGQRLLARRRLQEQIRDYCQAMQTRGREVLIVGDLSFPPDPQWDVAEGEKEVSWPSYIEHDRAWLQELGMIDCYRAFHPDERSYSTSTRFVFPGLPGDQDMRTTVALSTPRLMEKHVAECFYVDFSHLRYPDPRAPRRSSSPGQESHGKEGEDGEEGTLPLPGTKAPASPVYRYLHAAHFPLVLSLTVPALAPTLPSADDFPPEEYL